MVAIFYRGFRCLSAISSPFAVPAADSRFAPRSVERDDARVAFREDRVEENGGLGQGAHIGEDVAQFREAAMAEEELEEDERRETRVLPFASDRALPRRYPHQFAALEGEAQPAAIEFEPQFAAVRGHRRVGEALIERWGDQL